MLRWSRELSGETRLLLFLCLWAVATGVVVTSQGNWASLNLLVLPLVVASLNLSSRRLSWFVVGIMALAVIAVASRNNPTAVTVTSTASIFVIGFLVMLASFRRSRLGVGGSLGEAMFVDLRDRLLRQGAIPALPDGWLVEAALVSAGGTLFAGDFVVTSRQGSQLEVAVVDVSGKGESAGPRALQLCGALGGLLGAAPPADFLTAANEYLMRQEWDEGFATAVYLVLDLDSGEFELRTAGHPPALYREHGAWRTNATEGPALGLLPHSTYEPARGTLRPGESLLLYTDGLIDDPSRDLDVGIARVAAEAEVQTRRDLVGAGQRIVNRVGARRDDRTLVLVHRL